MAPNFGPSLPARSAAWLKSILAVCITLLQAGLSQAEPPGDAAPATNCVPVPAGWLQVPGREVVLDFRAEGVQYGCRQDEGEFLLSVLNALLQAGYTVRLSDAYLQDEIVYYSLNQEREKPAAMSHGILECLRQARKAQSLDWDCFRAISRTTGDLISSARNLPWMSPPIHIESVALAGAGVTNLPQLHLRMQWHGVPVRSAVQYSGWRMPPRQGALLLRETTLWGFSANLRLEQGEQVLFTKDYPQDTGQKEYIGADTPLERSIQRILQDLDTGLKPKPTPAPQPKGKKNKAKAAKKPTA